MAEKLQIQVVLSAIAGAAASVFRSTSAESKKLAAALSASRAAMKQLNAAQAQIDGFRKLREQAGASGAALRAAKAATSEYTAKLATARAAQAGLASQVQSGRRAADAMARALRGQSAPSARLLADQAAQRAALDKLEAKYKTAINSSRKIAEALKREDANVKKITDQRTKYAQRLREQAQALDAAGIKTSRLAAHETELKEKIKAANAAMESQRADLDKLNAAQKRAAAASATLQGRQGFAAHATVSGYGAMHAGARMLHGTDALIDEAKEYQRQLSQMRLMGLGEQQIAEAERFARANDIIGSSLTDRVKMFKESMAITRDVHHAEEITPLLMKMKLGVETVMNKQGHGEGHGEKMEAMFMSLVKTAELRGALKDPEKFKRVLDMAMRTYVSSGGQVTPDDMLDMIKTGGVAAKSMADESFFYGLMHTAQETGGLRAGTGLASAYQNWAAGRGTIQSSDEMVKLGLIKQEAIHYTKTGSLKKIAPDALIGGEKYTKDPFAYLMEEVVPRIKESYTKAGIAEADITKQMVVTKINQLFSARKGGDLFAGMYLENENISKHIEAARHAQGVEGAYKEASQGAGGKEAELRAKLADMRRELGATALPLYIAALDKLSKAAKAASEWMEKHPRLAKALTLTLAGTGLLAVALGSVGILVGSIVGPFAMASFVMSKFGGEGSLLASALEKIAPISKIASGGLWSIVRAMWGVALNPVGLAIAALAVAGVLLWKYWEPVCAFMTGFFDGLWQSLEPIRKAFNDTFAPMAPVFDAVGAAIAPVIDFFASFFTQSTYSNDELQGFTDTGRTFGEVFGYVLNTVLAPFRATLWLLGAIIKIVAPCFVSALDEIKTAFSGGIEGISALILNWSPLGLFYRAFASTLNWFGFELPAKFSEFGSKITGGFAAGVLGNAGPAKDAATGGGWMGWIKGKLGIPARPNGLPVLPEIPPLLAAPAAPLKASSPLTRKMAAASAGLSLAMPGFAAEDFSPERINAQLDTRPPLTARAPAQSGPQIGSIVINVTAAPGMDTVALAKEVRRQIEQLPRSGSYDARLHDKD